MPYALQSPAPATSCPFLEQRPDSCSAAVSERSLERSRRTRRCLSEEHDGCPLFMARLLRSSPVERSGVLVNLYLK